jgi:Transposase DDE domain group 1
MQTNTTELTAHPAGEQPLIEDVFATADTFGGRVQVEWDSTSPVTPLGQLPFFIDYLKQGGLFDAWVADCPLMLHSPNAPRKRDLLGTLLLSTLAGQYRYAHVTALRCDAVNPPLLGMSKVVSEDSLRRNLAKIDETAGLSWLQNHLDYCAAPLLSEPWVLDIDTTVKPLYGHQEGAVVGYNPHKPGRPSHSYHTYLVSNLRLVLRVDVLPGDEHNVTHATDGLWNLLDHLGRHRWPSLLRGDKHWGIEPVMAGAEQRGVPYLFCLRLTKNVGRALQRAMREGAWSDAGQGWQGQETELRLMGWSRQRRIILLRRKLRNDLTVAEDAQAAQKRLSFAEIDGNGEIWEFAALVTSLANEILTLGQLYRDRADCEIYQTRGLSRFSSGARCRTRRRDDRRRKPTPGRGRCANRSQRLDCHRIGMHQNKLIPPDENRAAS